MSIPWLSSDRLIEFVGVVVRDNGREVIHKVREPVPVYKNDRLEIEVIGGLYVMLARDPVTCFGLKQPNLTPQNRADRRREEKMQKALRLITLE